MIIISNLRKETKGNSVRIVCDIESDFSCVRKLWFSVPQEYGAWLTDDVYDALMLAMLYPAMYYNEDIKVEGMVSERLHYNLTNYVQSVVTNYRPEMHPVKITVRGYNNAERVANHVGTAFSAGVDAFTTLYDHFDVEDNDNYKIDALFFFNLGSHGGGGERARQKFHSRFDYLKLCTDRLSLPFIPLDSNLFDFYFKHWEFDAGIFCRAAGALVFEKALRKYYVASDNSYGEQMDFLFDKSRVDLSSLAETYLFPLLSTEVLELIPDGAQYTRTQKTKRIVDLPLAQQYLNVCVNNSETSHENCSICHKCQRTIFALDVLGKMPKFSQVFDSEKWEKHKFFYKCTLVKDYYKDVYAKDNVDFARKHNYDMPSLFMAKLVVGYHESLLAVKRFLKPIILGMILRKRNKI